MTNEEINALSDEQINEMIENLTYWSADYCSDPAAMMPIVFDYNMNIIAPFGNNGIWSSSVSVNDDCFMYADKNPLRAAAIVYLKMRGIL